MKVPLLSDFYELVLILQQQKNRKKRIFTSSTTAAERGTQKSSGKPSCSPEKRFFFRS
jgi:hypothetical protein